jgi:DNA-binding winged helix-turn-helix (wHTH) protein/tetratricopeptide (TPR) repeat protein
MTNIALGPFRLDAWNDLLLRGTVPVALGKRPIALLRALAERPGELVSKDALIEAAWPGQIVEENNLTVQIAALRRVLAEAPGGSGWIETMHRRGYRFIGPVVSEAQADATSTPQAETASASEPDAEQRQIAVLSCELIGDLARADGGGLEELRAAVGDFRRRVAETAQRHGGRVVGRVGNAEFVLFGYPEAHEDDAEQAVRAALELSAARIAAGSDADPPLRCRVGLATGMAIIDDAGRGGWPADLGIIGNTPNLAGQLRQSAQPGTVVIEPSTRRLIGNQFECRDLGNIDTGEALPIWQVVVASHGESRFEALRQGTRTPLVGRDEEIELLLRRWERAKVGDGQVVLISGEAGVGKSRITVELASRLRSEPHLHYRYSCSPSYQDSALFPFISQLAQAAEFAHHDAPATKLAKLETFLAPGALSGEDVALLVDLLSLPASDQHPLPDLTPQRKRERLREALMQQLQNAARQHPLVLVFEDAHWIDPTSRELLELIIERVRRLPVLLMVTFRPDFQAPWIGQPHVSALNVSRLDRREGMALVAQIARKALPDEVAAQLVERTDGVPLFVEELTKTVLESGLLREEADRYVLVRALSSFAIPTSLRASLLARLDRLASVRRVAQIGAVIGREFSYSLLHAVSQLAEEELQGSLDRLVAAELVFPRGRPPDATYTFKHALVQDAVRGTLLRGARRQLHARIAKVLEFESPEMMDTQPEVFAQHYAEAGLVEKSVAFWGKAGDHSVARSATAEAAAQYQQGLDQLTLLPDTPERQQRELVFLKGLGAALQSTKGYGASETGEIFARARKLWEQLGSRSEFLQIPYGQSRHYMARGELDRALWLAEDLLRLGLQRADSAGLVLGHLACGRTLFIGGMLAPARSHLEEVLVPYEPIAHHSLADQTGTHLHVVAQAHLAIVLFALGFPDQAMAQTSAAIAEARRLAHPPSLAASLTLTNILLSLIGDDEPLGERASKLVAMATEQGFAFRRAMRTISRGWLKVKNGDAAEGISLLRRGLAAYRATGAEVWVPHYLTLVARACQITEEIEQSFALLDEAFQIVERTGERWFVAELHRHKGELLLQQGHAEAAEELYCKALDISREQEARLWELRAAVSLAQLRRDQGRHAEARDLLAPIYGWFAEGFGTTDLKEAAVLLAELA